MNDRCHYVYRTYASGVSTAVRSTDVVGRAGLLTLDEAKRVAERYPGTWIGRLPGTDEPLEAVFRVE